MSVTPRSPQAGVPVEPPDHAMAIDVGQMVFPPGSTVLFESFDGTRLHIQVLRGDSYLAAERSDLFPGFPLIEAIPRFLERSRAEGRTRALRAFRRWVEAIRGSA